jgi:LmbE family N-acetylglucosaminyl deacetylase
MTTTRRTFLAHAAALAISSRLLAEPAAPAKPLSVVCVGGHPDDPESGAAGTLARYADLGHRVSVVYLTRGERGIANKSLEESARIRSAEAQAACKIIGATAHFAGQIDGDTEFSPKRTAEFTKLLTELAPDLVFTHWPVDTHPDHQVAATLTIQACRAIKPRPQLYYFEVNTGEQTQTFTPSTYVDISPTIDRKKNALFAHISQDGAAVWREHHEIIATWRGREAGVKYAEAFVHHARDKAQRLPLL